MTLDTPEKVRENRLRRMAARQGLTLHRSHRRDPLATDFGRVTLVGPRRKVVAAGSLDEIEAWLSGDRTEG
jgi:hypothetical protein